MTISILACWESSLFWLPRVIPERKDEMYNENKISPFPLHSRTVDHLTFDLMIASASLALSRLTDNLACLSTMARYYQPQSSSRPLRPILCCQPVEAIPKTPFTFSTMTSDPPTPATNHPSPSAFLERPEHFIKLKAGSLPSQRMLLFGGAGLLSPTKPQFIDNSLTLAFPSGL